LLGLAASLMGPFGCSSEPTPAEATGGRGGSSASTAGGNPGGAPGTAGTQISASGGQGSAGSGGAPAPTAGTAGTASTAGAAGNSAGDTSSGGTPGGASGNGGAGGTGGGTAGGAGSGGTSGDGTKPIKVWIAGDSTVQNCSSACPCGWGSQFDALFNDDVTVVNSAVGGRSIQSWLYEASVGDMGKNGECTLTSSTYDKRWTAMLDANTGMKAGDFLFIQFGINDGSADCPRHVGLPLFKTYLAAMAQAAKERGAQAVFVTPVSAIICSGSAAQPTRGKFVDATVEAATAAGVPLLDLHQRSIALYDSLGFCPNDENWGAGKLGAFFCQDHTHFEAAGAKQIAELVAGALEGKAAPLAKYRK
jgi:lysophospholipase L1-like esterase